VEGLFTLVKRIKISEKLDVYGRSKREQTNDRHVNASKGYKLHELERFVILRHKRHYCGVFKEQNPCRVFEWSGVSQRSEVGLSIIFL
jgi:hypothetical protein